MLSFAGLLACGMTLPPRPTLRSPPLPAKIAGGLFLFKTSVPQRSKPFANQLLELSQAALRSDPRVTMELGMGIEAGGVFSSASASSADAESLVVEFMVVGGNIWAQATAYGVLRQGESTAELLELDIANMDAALMGETSLSVALAPPPAAPLAAPPMPADAPPPPPPSSRSGAAGISMCASAKKAASGVATLEVELTKPLGLVLEEREAGGGSGVEIGSTVEGSTAEKSGKLQPGDALRMVGDVDVSSMSFDDVMETLVAAPSPVRLSLARMPYPEDDSPLDITPNLLKSLKPEDMGVVDATVRAARSAVRASPGAQRDLGRLLRIEIIVGAGVQKDGSVKVRFFGIFSSTGTGGSSYSCNISATGQPGADGEVSISKLSCAKDEGWGRTIDLL